MYRNAYECARKCTEAFKCTELPMVFDILDAYIVILKEDDVNM